MNDQFESEEIKTEWRMKSGLNSANMAWLIERLMKNELKPRSICGQKERRRNSIPLIKAKRMKWAQSGMKENWLEINSINQILNSFQQLNQNKLKTFSLIDEIELDEWNLMRLIDPAKFSDYYNSTVTAAKRLLI